MSGPEQVAVAPWQERVPSAASAAAAKLGPMTEDERRGDVRQWLVEVRAAVAWRSWVEQVPEWAADPRATDMQQPPGRDPQWWLRNLTEQQQPARIEAWLGDGDSPTLWLVGSVGVGKTRAAVAAGYAAADAAATARAVRFTALSSYLAKLRPDGDPNPVAVRRWAAGSDLLILDDVGAEVDQEASEFARRELLSLVNGRLDRAARQVLTTNLTPDQLTDAYGPRIVSRLRDRAAVIRIDGGDRRGTGETAARLPWV